MKICAESELLGTFQIGFTTALPKGWPLPSWRGWGLTPSPGKEATFLDLSEMSLSDLLTSLCPKPGFVDLREIEHFLSAISTRVPGPLPSLSEIYELPEDGGVNKLLAWLDFAPLKFWQWCDQKSLKWGHLRALALLAPSHRDWLTALGEHSPSLQEGHRVLEWCVELELMETPSEQLSPRSGESFKEWEQRLKSLRFPHSEEALQKGSQRVEQMNWPKGVQGRWLRQGDRQVLEVRLQAGSKIEFRKQLERLSAEERLPWT